MDTCSPLMAEAKAMQGALVLAKDVGLNNLVVEGDSKYRTDAIAEEKHAPGWECVMVLEDIKELKLKFFKL